MVWLHLEVVQHACCAATDLGHHDLIGNEKECVFNNEVKTYMIKKHREV